MPISKRPTCYRFRRLYGYWILRTPVPTATLTVPPKSRLVRKLSCRRHRTQRICVYLTGVQWTRYYCLTGIQCTWWHLTGIQCTVHGNTLLAYSVHDNTTLLAYSVHENTLLAYSVHDNTTLLAYRVPDNTTLLAYRVPDNTTLLAYSVHDNTLLISNALSLTYGSVIRDSQMGC